MHVHINTRDSTLRQWSASIACCKHAIWSYGQSIAKSLSPTFYLVLCRQKHDDWFVAIQVAAPDLGLKRREVLDWIHITEEGGAVRLPQHQNERTGSVICGNYLISWGPASFWRTILLPAVSQSVSHCIKCRLRFSQRITYYCQLFRRG